MLSNVVTDQSSLNLYLKVRVAAQVLGVHPDTLRRWERTGKLPTYRHPINRYRLYLMTDLEQLLKEVRLP